MIKKQFAFMGILMATFWKFSIGAPIPTQVVSVQLNDSLKGVFQKILSSYQDTATGRVLAVSSIFTLSGTELYKRIQHLDSMQDKKKLDSIPIDEKIVFKFSPFASDTPISLKYDGYHVLESALAKDDTDPCS